MTIYLGQTCDSCFCQDIARLGLGRIWSTQQPKRCYDGEPLAIDNGAYSAWRSGKQWDAGRFRRRLDALADAKIEPNFVCLPDVVGDPVETAKRSWSWIDQEWRWYFVLQDGVTVETVETFLPHVSGLFLGGTAEWQHGAVEFWRRWTRDKGKPLHWGGVGRLWELRAAHDIGVDSLDTSQPLWSRDHWDRWLRELDSIRSDAVLPGLERTA